MKILIVTQYFWPENFKINDFALGMSEFGHSVTVLTGKPNYPSGKFFKGYNFINKRTDLYHDIKIIRAPLISRGKGGGFRLMLNYFSFAFFASIRSIFNINEKYDIIFVYEPSPITVGIPAVFLKKRLGIPMILWVLDLWPESVEIAGKIKNRQFLNFLNKLVIKIYKNSDRIFISSRSFLTSIQKKHTNPAKVIYFPNWPEDIYLSSSTDRPKFSYLMPSGFKIMFAGNIGDSQDFESIIKTAELLRKNRDIHWIIIGDGRRKLWLEQEIKKMGLHSNFHLLGSFPTEEMPNFFCHCDAMLVTLKESEIFSMTVPAKIQSYLAFGKPILAMLNGEGALIIEEAKAGISCNAGDYKQLAENIIHLYHLDPGQRSKMGDHAKEYCNNHFNRRNLFLKFEHIVDEIKS